MPTTEKMHLRGFTFHPRNETYAPYRIPLEGVFLGSTDGNNWYPIHYFYDFGITNGAIISSTKYFEPTNHLYYNHIAFVAYKLQNNSNGSVLNFAELDLYGTPEYDPEAHGTDATIKSVANVPNTDWLEVYYDAKNYTTGVVQDETANNRDGVLYGNTILSSADGIHKFDFDGNGDYIKTTLTGFTGTTVTFSAWVFMDSVAAGRANTIMGLGNWGGTGSASWLAVGTTGFLETGSISIGSCASSVQASTLTGRWLHMTGIVSSGDFRLYQNGQLIKSLNTTGTINYGSNPVLYLATRANSSGNPESTRYFDCKIANARLFNRALTSDEIYQLYAYQKEYFGHGDLGMTLKAGRLGIGTSEPLAALDVDGVIKSNSPAFCAYEYDGYTVTAGNTYVTLGNTFVNKGGCYDTSNGIFTAPISGTYRFTVDSTIRSPGSTGTGGGTGATTITLYINNVNWNPTSTGRPLIYQAIDPGTNHQHVSGSLVRNLNAGDTVRIHVPSVQSSTDINWGTGYSRFIGYLIS